MPILKANDDAGLWVQLAEPVIDFLRNDRGRIVSLESQPSYVCRRIVVTLDLHKSMLPPSPHGYDPGIQHLACVRVVVDDNDSAHSQSPVGGSVIALAICVTIGDPALNIRTGDPQHLRFRERMIRPREANWDL